MLITGYSGVSITPGGIPGDLSSKRIWGVYFKLDNDIRDLFPYINSTAEHARYQLHPLHVRFRYKKVACTLYPVDAMAAPLRSHDQALEFIEELVVFLNDLHARRGTLAPSHRIYQQPVSVVAVLKTLPLTNCRTCGYPTCMAFAAAIRSGKALPERCPDFARPISVRAIYPVFGPDGAIASTLAIETPGEGLKPSPSEAAHQEREHGQPAGIAPEAAPALYDRHGIRIQYDLSPR